MSRIVSTLPGRIRVRDAALRNPARLARLAAALGALGGVRSVQPNAGAGSIVLYYDVVGADIEAMEHAVDAATDAELAAPRPAGRRSSRVRINRYAKAGMLGSLGASLVFAAAGAKRWHVVTGGMFVACLAVHIGVHRRHLLR